MDWFEAISENYMDTGGRPLAILEKVRRHYPIALHGTSLSIGSVDPLSPDYLLRLKNLIQRIDPFIVSDHLCWSSVGGDALHDLLPLPFTEEAIAHVTSRVRQVQDFIGRPMLLENVSTYVTYRHSTIPEWEFLREVARRSGCGILLDLNNLYVNSFNHGFDPMDYLRQIPGKLVGQFHLAGHTDMGKFLFDTHSAHVIDPVWELYREALKRWGPISTLIEWDEAIPSFEVLAEEARKARTIYRKCKPGGVTNSATLSQPGTSSNASSHAISLSNAQLWMKSRIQPWEKKSTDSVASESILNPQAGDPGEERMTVYASGYLARIRETLLEVYEAVRKILGPERFDELATDYAHRFPSRNYNLNYAGRHFEEFLRFIPGGINLDFLPDLAKFEWAVWEAFHAFDEKPLDLSETAGFAEEDWENIRFEFQPSVRLVISEWPVLDLWLERKRPEDGVSEKNRAARSQRVLIGRKEDQVRTELLDENQHRLLEGLLAGKTLGEVSEELADRLREDEMPPVSEWFSRWVREGLIRGLKLPQNTL